MERKPFPIPASVLLLLLLSSPFLIFVLCLLIGGTGDTVVEAHRSANSELPRFEKAVASTAPDGKTRFTADGNGVLRLCDVRTGRMLQAHWESPADYRGISRVTWQDNRRVLVSLTLRYPARAHGRTCVWDSVTGAWHDLYAGGRR